MDQTGLVYGEKKNGYNGFRFKEKRMMYRTGSG